VHVGRKNRHRVDREKENWISLLELIWATGKNTIKGPGYQPKSGRKIRGRSDSHEACRKKKKKKPSSKDVEEEDKSRAGGVNSSPNRRENTS